MTRLTYACNGLYMEGMHVCICATFGTSVVEIITVSHWIFKEHNMYSWYDQVVSHACDASMQTKYFETFQTPHKGKSCDTSIYTLCISSLIMRLVQHKRNLIDSRANIFMHKNTLLYCNDGEKIDREQPWMLIWRGHVDKCLLTHSSTGKHECEYQSLSWLRCQVDESDISLIDPTYLSHLISHISPGSRLM